MQNVGAEQFDFETFKAAYDSDERLKALIKDFNKNGIQPKTEKDVEEPSTAEPGKDVVGQMAKRATDLGGL